MYDNYFIILFIAGNFAFIKAQTPVKTLLAIPSYTTAVVSATTLVTECSLAFDSDPKKLFQWDGTIWKELLLQPKK